MLRFKHLQKFYYSFTKLILLAALIILPVKAQNRQSSTAANYTALVNADLIDGTGKPLRKGQTILIKDDRIAAVGANVKIPKDAKVIDLSGKTVIPGLFDMHGHFYANSPGESQLDSYPLLFLAGGVTSVRSPGEIKKFEEAFALRERIKAGQAVGPRMFIFAYFDGAETFLGIRGVKSPEDATALFNELRGRIDGVKFYQAIKEPELLAVLNAARKAGLPTTGHLNSVTATKAVELGIGGLEHGIFAMSELSSKDNINERYCELSALNVDSPAVEKLIDGIVKKKVFIDPTIIIYQKSLPDSEPVSADWQKYIDTETNKWFPLWLQWWRKQPFGLKPDSEPCLKEAINKQMRFVKKIHDKGGLIVAGTDPVRVDVIPGYGLHRELRNLVQAGLTPLEAIKAATLNAAVALHREKDLGSVEKGKLADLVVLGDDPSTNISAVGKTETVYLGGVAYNPAELRRAAEGKIK